MKLHVLSVPNTVTSTEYLSCAFTQKVLKFCKMMRPLYEIIHYGHEKSLVDCHEHVTVTNDEVLSEAYGNYNWKKELFRHNNNDFAHKIFNENAKKELGKRVSPGDAILCFWGGGVSGATDGFSESCFIVEPGIGYVAKATFAPFKVFESYSHMHAVYGALGIERGQIYDAVIPNYFEISDFRYNEEKEDYFLYLGRITLDKGLHIAIEVTKKIGVKLVVAGQGNFADIGIPHLPAHVEHVGYAELNMRKELLARARALILPTLYLEPFGGVTIEAMLSGTPVITTDWGAFAENNLHGITGFRCRNDEEFYSAAKNIDRIEPKNCRAWAESNFSTDRISQIYDEYFKKLQRNFDSEGEQDLEDEDKFSQFEVDSLGWLDRNYLMK